MRTSPSHTLRRLVGGPTALLIGMGVAVGSGIFRTPGEVAARLTAPGLILAAWMAGGLIVLMQSMVTAELATRFPRAGGEYVFLREAYGEFAAFFFGWAYSVFSIGVGSAAIAVALGEFAVRLLAVPAEWAGPIGALAVAAVICVNVLGLRTGANTQNILTTLKVAAIAGLAVVGLARGQETVPLAVAAPDLPTSGAFLTAMLSVLWSYDGTTDSVKLAEEIKDVRRALPRAVIASTLALTALYLLVNVALLRVMPAGEMAGHEAVLGEAMGRLLGPAGRSAMLLLGILVCLGSLSSTVPATIRVTFALARDGLAPRKLAEMSAHQAPVPALMTIGAVIILVTLYRSFAETLSIYFFAMAVLFSLAYASLIVFRIRGKTEAAEYFRCPAGVAQAVVLIVIHAGIAANIVVESPRSAVETGVLLAGIVVFYGLWKWWGRGRGRAG